jgi:hypothetical protein
MLTKIACSVVLPTIIKNTLVCVPTASVICGPLKVNLYSFIIQLFNFNRENILVDIVLLCNQNMGI